MTNPYSADRSFSQAGDRLWGDHDPAEAVPYALVSIAASLRDITQTPVRIEGELLTSGYCRQGERREDENRADDMLEAAFGLICNAGNSISSGGDLQAEWDEAAQRFIDSYNARMCVRCGLDEEEFTAGAMSTLHTAMAILERHAMKYDNPAEAIAKTQEYLATLLDQWGASTRPPGRDWDQVEAESRDEVARHRATEADAFADELAERSAD